MFAQERYEDAVSRSHQSRQADEYLIWRSPQFDPLPRWILLVVIIFAGIIVFAMSGLPDLIGIWIIATPILGIWRMATPFHKVPFGYTVTSKRLIVFNLYRTFFRDQQTAYELCCFHPPVIEQNLVFRKYGDLRFDRASSNPGSWRDSWPVRALSVLFESVRIRDVRNPEIVAELISKDMSIEWGEPT